jgi:hypothetical protein
MLSQVSVEGDADEVSPDNFLAQAADFDPSTLRSLGAACPSRNGLRKQRRRRKERATERRAKRHSMCLRHWQRST